MNHAAPGRWVGRWGLLALLASASLALGRVLLPSARLAAGLSGLVFSLRAPIQLHHAVVEDHEGVGWPEQAPSDDEAADRLRLLSGPIERLSSVEAIVAHALGWAQETLTSPWAAIVLCPGGSPAALHGLGEYPDDLERLVLGETEGAASDGRVGAAAGVRVVPLVAGGATVGVLALPVLEPAAEVSPWRHERLVEAAAPLIAAAVWGADLVRQREELSAILTERERELSALSEQVVRAQEEVRRRIALDLHDEPLQRAILLYRAIREAADHPCAARWLVDVEAIATSIRAICNGLRPRVLDDFGLVAGLEWLVDDVRARSDLTVFLTTASAESLSSDRLSADLELALFRVAQEALNNCLKHARATQVHVTLWCEGSWVRLTVADDGARRPDPPWPGERRGHLGIAGMSERLHPWGGVVTVRAGSDSGTVVTAEVSTEDGVGRDE